jgi:hypothetical protein
VLEVKGKIKGSWKGRGREAKGEGGGRGKGGSVSGEVWKIKCYEVKRREGKGWDGKG